MSTTDVPRSANHETSLVRRGSVAVQADGELDAAVALIHKLKGDAAVSGWALGKAVFDIASRGLWRLRRDLTEKGDQTPRWSSFDAFCRSELSMTPTNARTLMDVSQAFTEAEVRAWGTHKLGLLLQAPPTERPQLQKLLEGGGSYRQVREEVGRVKRASGYSKPSRAGNARGGKTGQKGRQTRLIPVSKLLGASTVKLFVRPDSMEDIDWKALDRATRVAQQPVGRLDLTDEVRMLFGVSASPSGELQLKVMVERSEG
jgi:hypothetical protein